MTTLNPTLSHEAPNLQAASLAHTVSWRLHRIWAALERMGQRRAASELARLAARLAETEPELAATIAARAREWKA